MKSPQASDLVQRLTGLGFDTDRHKGEKDASARGAVWELGPGLGYRSPGEGMHACWRACAFVRVSMLEHAEMGGRGRVRWAKKGHFSPV